MPIRTIRLHTGIYLGEWVGFITLKDVHACYAACESHAESAQDSCYVYVADLRAKESFPVNLLEYQQMLRSSERLVGIVAVQPCSLSQALGRVLRTQLHYEISRTSSVENAISVAQSMIRQQQSRA